MSAGKLSEYILTGVALAVVGYLWLITVLVQGPKP